MDNSRQAAEPLPSCSIRSTRVIRVFDKRKLQYRVVASPSRTSSACQSDAPLALLESGSQTEAPTAAALVQSASQTEFRQAEPPVALPPDSQYDFSQLQPEQLRRYLGSGRSLEPQAQAIVLSVIQSCEKELINGGALVSPTKVQDRAASFCSIGRRTLQRLVKRAREEPVLERPGKVRDRGGKYVKVDGFVIEACRKLVHRHFSENKHVTLNILLEKCQDEFEFPYGRSILHVLLLANGFKYKRRGNRLILTEKAEIRAWRERYLRTSRALEQSGNDIYFLDETWVNAGYVTPKAWYDLTVEKNPELALVPNSGLTLGPKDPTGKGERLIITHIGNEKGFLPGGLLSFKSTSTGDYHEEMNSARFEVYFEEQVIPNLPQGAVVVLDNASYHSRLLDPPPNSNSKRGDMERWLDEHELPYEHVRTKQELYRRFVKPVRDDTAYKKYVLDELASEHGVVIVRLPPYHCQLNPIELIWALLKTRIAKRNEKHTLTALKEIFAEEVARISADDWRKACGHVKRVAAEFYGQHGMAPAVASVIIGAQDQGSDDPQADFSSSDDDDDDDDGAATVFVQPDENDVLPPEMTLQQLLEQSQSTDNINDLSFEY